MQFAALRTDLDLQPVAEPVVHYCQPVEDVLPHPMATLVTGLTPQQARKEGVPEPQFAAAVEAEFSQPGTCGAGYNSIRFDDEVTRYTFYRNFYDPYAREWRNGNSRWDIIDMVRMAYALKPEILTWPEREPGVSSFKLELLTQANGIAHESAHDALSDVQATIALARLLKDRAPEFYEYCWKLRSKDYVLQRLGIADHHPFLHVSSRFPARQGCLAIVAPLVRMKSNTNAVLLFDLNSDPSPLSDLDIEQIRARVFTPADQLDEGEQRLPLKTLHLNRSPMIAPIAMLSDERAAELGIDKARCEHNWRKLGDVASYTSVLQQVFEREYEPASDPELALYADFIPDADRPLCERVRMAQGEALSSESFPFVDERLGELLFRYRARFFPESLTKNEQAEWREQVSGRLLRDDASDYQCLKGYFAVVEALLEERSSDEPSKALLQSMKEWGTELQQKYSQA